MTRAKQLTRSSRQNHALTGATKGKAMSKSKEKNQERARCTERLHALLKPGATVYTILRHVSRSGMMRVIDCYVIIDDMPYCISYPVSRAIDMSADSSGIKVNGGGMDMGFALVDDLNRTLGLNGTKRLKHEWL